MEGKYKVVIGCFGMGCITTLGVVAMVHLGIDGQLLAGCIGGIGGIIGYILGKKTTVKEE